MCARQPRIAVVIPTLNEAGSIDALLQAVFALDLELQVYVMDDGSVDGTLEILDILAAEHASLHVVRRDGARGYGKACTEGLQRALQDGADVLLQMDGDLSHDPSYIPAMLDAALDADLVLGSRYLKGVSVANWSLKGLLLPIAANFYVRAFTGVKTRDCTTGYRLWHRSLLEQIELQEVRSEGYAFIVETLFRASRLSQRITEVPIIFIERKLGHSKLSSRVILESPILPLRLFSVRVLDLLRFRGDPG